MTLTALTPALLVAAALAAVTSAAHGQADGPTTLGPEPRSGPGGIYVSGRAVAARLPGGRGDGAWADSRVRRAKLQRTPRGFVVGTGVPWVRLRPDGRWLAYETWRAAGSYDRDRPLQAQGVEDGDPLGYPRVRLRDMRRRKERFLEPGSTSFSFGAGGRLAYAVSRDPALRANRPFLRHVMVRRSVRRAARRWTTEPDRYTVLGWAGRRIVADLAVPADLPRLVVFDGPRRVRVLREAASLIALSPDGALAAVTVRPPGATPTIELLDVASGSAVAVLSAEALIDPRTGRPVEWLREPGHWVGESIVLGTDSGAAVLRAAGHQLSVQQVLSLDLGGQAGQRALQEPRFADGAGTVVVGWAPVEGDSDDPRTSAQYACDWRARTCGRRVHAARVSPRPIFDHTPPR